MSKLDELISELCPDGVEYRALGEVLTIKNGRDYKKFGEGNIPVYGSGGIITYIDTAVFDKPSVLIPRKGSLNKLYYVEAPFWTVDTIFYTDINTAIVKPKYIFYSLEGKHLERLNSAGGVPSLTQGVLNKIIIPVPPLQVQSELVRILDKFTELTTELTTELSTRKKQYEYYRNQLLEFPKNECSMVAISELGKWSGGKTPPTANKEYWENGTIPWISSKDMKTSTLEDTEDHLTEKALEDGGMKLFPKGIVAIVIRSGILKHTFPIAYVPFRTTVNQDIKALVVKDGISSRYVFHAMQAYAEDIRKSTKKQGGTVDSLDFQRLLAYKIPVPTLEVQKRLADVLDNFESICSDLNIGLPAEIELRKKQYEFYRAALLTFTETGNIIAQTDRQTDIVD